MQKFELTEVQLYGLDAIIQIRSCRGLSEIPGRIRSVLANSVFVAVFPPEIPGRIRSVLANSVFVAVFPPEIPK